LYLVERSRDQVGLQYSYCYNIEEDSRTYNEAMQSRDSAFWKEALDDEIGSNVVLEENWIDIGAIGFGHIGISCIKFLSHSASLPAAANATNLDSIVEPVMHVCFLEAHEMEPLLIRNTHPLVVDESLT
nr:zinc finger, CCHC-type [Tanacetum cinerariifolium]